MTVEEFLKTNYHTRNSIIIPLLGRIAVDKSKFFIKGKYSIEKQNEYLREIFELNKSKLKA